MTAMQPITLHAHTGPNPWKIAIVLEELSIPYENKVHTTEELSQPAFLSINGNALTPVIEDPNTKVVLSESGIIMEYILEQYDPAHLLSFGTLPEQYRMRQWLQFQNTTQGPTVQAIFHFTFKQPNAEARAHFVQKMLHMFAVVEKELSNKEWLVGGRISAADLSFVPFHQTVDRAMKKDMPNMAAEFPRFHAWFRRMEDRAIVGKVMGDRGRALARLQDRR